MTFKTGLCQMAGSLKEDMAENKKETWAKAEQMIREAASNGAQKIALPEMWNCPYSNDFFRAYSESADGETVGRMSELAKTLGIYLIGGSIPELDDDRIICRCEEVTKGEIRRAVHDGMFTIAEIRRYLRCGMGLCQGQTCAKLVKRIVATELGVSPAVLEPATSRAPMRPLEMKIFAKEGEQDV